MEWTLMDLSRLIVMSYHEFGSDWPLALGPDASLRARHRDHPGMNLDGRLGLGHEGPPGLGIVGSWTGR